MKTLFFKNIMPIATAVLAITGAFITISMQKSSNTFATSVGYTLNGRGECNIPVRCGDMSTVYICRLGFNGPQAFGKEPQTGACTEVLWRSEP